MSWEVEARGKMVRVTLADAYTGARWSEALSPAQARLMAAALRAGSDRAEAAAAKEDADRCSP